MAENERLPTAIDDLGFADVEEKELVVGFWSCKSKRGWLLDDEL
jgi:hypothetical protein